MHQVMQEVALLRPAAPDLCYLHNFDTPEKPQALRLPAGQGRVLRQHMVQLSKALQKEIPQRLNSPDSKVEAERIETTYKTQEVKAYTELDAFAEARNFALYREEGRLVFTLLGEKGNALTEGEARSLPRERRIRIDAAEQELRNEISRYMDTLRPLERAMGEELDALRRKTIQVLLEEALDSIRAGVASLPEQGIKLARYLDRVMGDVLDNLEFFQLSEVDEAARQLQLGNVLMRYRVNLLVDNAGATGAPCIVENNPTLRSLFGSIDYQAEEDVLVTDFSRIRAGSVVRAHGGFLMLHLRDLLTDELVWEKLRRFTRSGRCTGQPGVLSGIGGGRSGAAIAVG